jgi:hypothetical protein
MNNPTLRWDLESKELNRQRVLATTWPFQHPPASDHIRQSKLLEQITTLITLTTTSIMRCPEIGDIITIPAGTTAYSCLQYAQGESDRYKLYEASEALLFWHDQLKELKTRLEAWQVKPSGIIRSFESVQATPAEISKFRDDFFKTIEHDIDYLEAPVTVEASAIDTIEDRYN